MKRMCHSSVCTALLEGSKATEKIDLVDKISKVGKVTDNIFMNQNNK